MKKTLILGATPNPERYAYKATAKLAQHGHEVVPVGIKKGEIEGHEILTNSPTPTDIDTVTLYVGPARQKENPELKKLAEEKGIATEEACTLVLLSIDKY